MPWPGISPESQYAWMGHSAHLFLADLFAEKGDTPKMIASLETALKSGADPQEVLSRITRIEQSIISL